MAMTPQAAMAALVCQRIEDDAFHRNAIKRRSAQLPPVGHPRELPLRLPRFLLVPRDQ
jgi:hypothetical protein